MVIDVTLIIPCKNHEENISKLLLGMMNWEEIPSEIIIIDSSKIKIAVPGVFKNFLKEHKIKLMIIYGEKLYPGHARNIGVNKSSNYLVAFLDTATSPSNSWLSSSVRIIEQDGSDGVWGNTYYQANTHVKKIFRACTFGDIPIQTLPGSVFGKRIFKKCGLFIEDTRAGEDGDWMSRVRLHKIKMSLSEEFLNYDELNKNNIKNLLKKWFRNYTHTAKLPFFRAHKDFYYYTISLVAVLFAYNWNRIFASWDMKNFLYIPNITTGLIFLLCLSYIFVRGIAVPFKKGVNLSFIFPVNFIFIAGMSSLIDLIKLIAFGNSRLINK
jgi:hypothetical protein